MPEQNSIIIEENQLKLSNLSKVLYPAAQFSKAMLLDYYIRIAPTLLPHLTRHPVTLKRYPDGVNNKFFYQKDCPKPIPEFMATVPVWSEKNQRHTNYCRITNLTSLVWAANLAALELHTSLSVYTDLPCPALVVFDLDPGYPASMMECVKVAFLMREIFDSNKLTSFPKTSGSKGLQIYIPLNIPTSYEETKLFARNLAIKLEKQYPDLIISNMRKSLRKSKVFIDWSQNDEHKTTVCVYSLRAKENPYVSTPVTWEELQQALQKQNPKLLQFTASDVLDRIVKFGDLFAQTLTLKQHLPVIT